MVKVNIQNIYSQLSLNMYRHLYNCLLYTSDAADE